ncbi:Gamma-glutamyltranspeptidase precursor [Pseudobythopirellula maris]|uniref:Glutathione hydrolase proenzyme n=1 Tax=Pseudobythopirellula maris TaxID=2527991 RepID=A0A5C5ZJ02_9BACT|nr:gamma-glutamyltransferase [Pseudobythopirellula maris]TWT87226.1 Gamma-glutamyltranspeptidase precursor [Pseudobythopirellula maris]
MRNCCVTTWPIAALLVGLTTLGAWSAPAALAGSAEGSRHAVATVHPLATDAAMAVYAEGGNAVDAAVTAALTLSVVDNHNSGIGGGCLILIRTPDGELLAIDGREMAPAAASPDMYLDENGEAMTEASKTGPLAVGTPGALAAYAEAIRLAGSKPLARLLEPGAHHAREGVAIDSVYARKLARIAKVVARYPGSRDALLKPDGSPYEEGETLVQTDLARTYDSLIEHGPDWFYRGPFAEKVGAWMEQNGGVLRASDFAAYEVKRRQPIVSTYRGRQIVGFPPPSSGGVHIAQMLNILERYDLGDTLRKDPVAARHLIAEAMKLAFADRAFWLGDSDFVDVPRGLTDKGYAAELAGRIDPERAITVERHGDPPLWDQDLFGRHTTHVAAADAEGYWVAITATVNTTFGSKVIVPGTGVVLNNEMDDFSIQPGVPNAFGLVGAANNAVAPGKRPLSSMSPTIVLDAEGEPLLTVGAAGGPKIITQVLQVILHRLDEQMPLEAAVAAPRIHHQWRPDALQVESTLPDTWVAELRSRGHELTVLSSAGITQAIARTDDGGLTATSDPRVPSKAAAQ